MLVATHNGQVELREAMGREAWAEVISHSFVPLAISETSTEFRGEVSQAVLAPGVTLTDVRTLGGSVVLRTDRLVRNEPREDYLLSLHLAGPGAVLQGDREVTLQVGGGALYDSARPYKLVFPDSTRELVLQVPRDAVRERLDDVADLYGRDLSKDEPAMRVLAGFLRELSATAGELQSAQLAEYGWTAVDLLATALRATTQRDSPVGARRALILAMREYVAAHLTSPDLTPLRLARVHGVSVRYVADLFAESGTSPAAFIRAERLRAARRALTDPRQIHRPVAVIAASVGFPDRTTFSRAFARQYGVTPTRARAIGGA